MIRWTICALVLCIWISSAVCQLAFGQSATGLSQDDVIQLHPDSQAVTLNSTVRLQCRVRILVDPETGTGAQVYWSKNDFGIGGSREDIQEYGRSARYPYSRYDLPYNVKDGQYDLQIVNVELSDEGAYVCQVNYKNKQFLSQTAVLTVQVPSEAPRLIQITNGGKGPEVEIGSSNPVIVDDGGVMVLKCVARHGKPGALLSWSVDGASIQLEPDRLRKMSVFRAGFTGNLTTQTTSSVKFSRLKDTTSQMSARLNKLHHGKLIECRATNAGYGEHALRPAFTKLEVQYAPVVSIHIRPHRPNNEYMEHDIITVECNAHGRPDTFVWEWFVNGRQVENIADPWYRLRLTQNMHSAVFRCIAISNKKGHAETTVRVRFGPQFLESSALLFTASHGEDVAMDCPARGNPTPRIDWRREGGHEVLHRGVTYRRDNLRPEDFGTYTCTAFGSGFPPVSKQMYIAKRKPPNIQPNPLIHARLGQLARLRCTVNSVPLPPNGQMHWSYNGRTVRPDTQHSFEREEFIGGVVLILQIAHVMSTDYGKYNCSVRNGYGSDWKLIELIRQEDLPMQFILGTAIAIGLVIVLVLILLCLCRQRICGRRYKKGRTNQPQTNGPMRPNPAVSLQDYGVVNSDFRGPISTPEVSYRQNVYPWFTNNTTHHNSYVRCGSDMDDQRSMNGTLKVNSDKGCYDEFKGDYCQNTDNFNMFLPSHSSNPHLSLGTSATTYGQIIPTSYQLIQPMCNGSANPGAGYLSTSIDPRLFTSPQTAALLASGYPTLLSNASMVGTTHGVPDFLSPTQHIQTTGSFDPINIACPYGSLGVATSLGSINPSPNNFDTINLGAVPSMGGGGGGMNITTDGAYIPQVTTLDLTNGIPHVVNASNIYPNDGVSARGSGGGGFDQPQAFSLTTKCDLSPTSGQLQQQQQQQQRLSINLTPTTTELNGGMTYEIDEHTTNV